MSVLHLTSLKYAVNQASFTAKNIIAAFAKNSIWQFTSLDSSDEELEPLSITPMEK